MRTISEQELKTILDKHGKWLRNEEGGEWKLAKSLDFNYWVSSEGKVASAITPALTLRKVPRLVKARKSKNGYLAVSFKSKNISVHRLVAQEFISDTTGKIVHHKNTDKTDNRVSNLVVTDSKTNNSEGFKTRIQMYGNFIKSCLQLFEADNSTQPKER